MAKTGIISLLGIGAWLVYKWFALGLLTWEQSTQGGVFWNLLMIVILAVIGTHTSGKERPRPPFIERWKRTARGTMTYVISSILAMGTWYFGIAKGAMEARKFEQVQAIYNALGTDAAFERLVLTQPALAELNRITVLETQLANLDIFYAPVFYLGIALLAWSFVALGLTAFIGFIWNRIWFV